jgi:hypothetical protein
MADTTTAAATAAKEPGKALRYWAVGLAALAVLAAVYMFSGVRPEGWLLDVSEASSTLIVPIALIVNVVSVVRRHRTPIDIASLAVSALLFGAYVVDAAIYTLTPVGG